MSRSALAGAVAVAFCFSFAGCDDTSSQPTMTTPTEEQKAKLEAANKAQMEAANAAKAANKTKAKH